MDVQQRAFASGVRTSVQPLMDQYSLVLRELDECEFELSGSSIQIWLGYSRDGPCCLVSVPGQGIDRKHLYQLYKGQFGEPSFRPRNPWSVSESIQQFVEMLGPVLNRYK